MTGELIKQTDVEVALAKISKFNADGLTHRQRLKLKEYDKEFAASFVILCEKTFGISLDQVNKLSDKDLIALDKALSQSRGVRTWTWVNKVSMILVVPWIAYAVDSDYPVSWFLSWHYLSSRKKLKAIYGENYFPAKTCRKAIKEL